MAVLFPTPHCWMLYLQYMGSCHTEACKDYDFYDHVFYGVYVYDSLLFVLTSQSFVLLCFEFIVFVLNSRAEASFAEVVRTSMGCRRRL